MLTSLFFTHPSAQTAERVRLRSHSSSSPLPRILPHPAVALSLSLSTDWWWVRPCWAVTGSRKLHNPINADAPQTMWLTNSTPWDWLTTPPLEKFPMIDFPVKCWGLIVTCLFMIEQYYYRCSDKPAVALDSSLSANIYKGKGESIPETIKPAYEETCDCDSLICKMYSC